MTAETTPRVELEACPNPWCGENQPDLIVWGKSQKWRVQCDCGIYPGDSDTEAEAIAAWNTRPQSSLLEEARAVVTPFARLANYIVEGSTDDEPFESILPEVGDLRRARAFLTRIEGEKK